MLVLAGALGGLVIGLGIVVLTAEPQSTPERYHASHLRAGSEAEPSLSRPREPVAVRPLPLPIDDEPLAAVMPPPVPVVAAVMPPPVARPNAPLVAPVPMPVMPSAPTPMPAVSDEELLAELHSDYLSMGAGYAPQPLNVPPPQQPLTPLPASGAMTFRAALEKISAGRL
jgi:hypothetical protein